MGESKGEWREGEEAALEIATPPAPGAAKKGTSYEKMPQEEILETRRERKTSGLNGGINETEFIELEDDGAGVFKPREGERVVRDEVEAGTYYKRERAAYLMDRFLGFGMVPPTVIRQIKGKVGSFQEFIPEALNGHMITALEYKKMEQTEFRRLWILDYILWNSDRHRGNFLYKDGKIYAIDNGLTFGNDDFIPHASFFGAEIPNDITEKLRLFLSWEQGKTILRTLLSELLSQGEVDACLARIEFIAGILKNHNGVPQEYYEELPFYPKKLAAPETQQ